MRLLKKILCVVFILLSVTASAEVFVVRKIHVSGLQRISLGTVLSYLPVKEGQKIDSSQTTDIIRELYKTNFFSDVTVKRSNNDLIINVVERSIIGSLNIVGNSKITKKQLIDGLKSVGLFEGQVLDPATVIGVKQALIQQYYSLGLYAAKVNIIVKPIVRNRVAVTINIKEGPTAKIKSIKIIGNKAFKERTLLKEFALTTTKLWSFLTSSDRYAKEKLDADLEKLRSYYMDRGYLHMTVDSTRVTITPDKKGIYITINITEGSVYRLGGYSVEGNLLGKRAEILKLITLKTGDVFSRKNIFDAQAKIAEFLGEYGYGMPDLQAIPNIDENKKMVYVKFLVDPGQRVYVRHIDFSGNYKTRDEVLRREMRMQEGGVFSISKINESKRRLANLGYLQNIEHKVVPVPESNNQVDLLYSVKETSAITAGIQAGLSDRDGFLYGANLNDQNVFGSGKSASIRFDNTRSTQYYGFSYHDPYFTANQVGFSLGGYLSKSNPNKISSQLTAYSVSTYGTIASFDAPLSDYTHVSFGGGFEHIGINTNSNTNADVKKFVDDNGSSFNQFKLVAGISYSNLDQAIFPTKGVMQSLNLEGYGPLNRKSLEFYKANYNFCWYQPLFKDFILRTSAGVGYGDGIGKTKELPFFKNFYAGGIGTVRGFEADTLTDKVFANNRQETLDKILGGHMLTVGSASLIIPSPMKDTIRPSIFVDVGNVFVSGFRASELRASYGIQIEWRTPLAPLLFSFAKPIRSKEQDHTTLFQFSISTGI